MALLAQTRPVAVLDPPDLSYCGSAEDPQSNNDGAGSPPPIKEEDEVWAAERTWLCHAVIPDAIARLEHALHECVLMVTTVAAASSPDGTLGVAAPSADGVSKVAVAVTSLPRDYPEQRRVVGVSPPAGMGAATANAGPDAAVTTLAVTDPGSSALKGYLTINGASVVKGELTLRHPHVQRGAATRFTVQPSRPLAIPQLQIVRAWLRDALAAVQRHSSGERLRYLPATLQLLDRVRLLLANARQAVTEPSPAHVFPLRICNSAAFDPPLGDDLAIEVHVTRSSLVTTVTVLQAEQLANGAAPQKDGESVRALVSASLPFAATGASAATGPMSAATPLTFTTVPAVASSRLLDQHGPAIQGPRPLLGAQPPTLTHNPAPTSTQSSQSSLDADNPSSAPGSDRELANHGRAASHPAAGTTSSNPLGIAPVRGLHVSLRPPELPPEAGSAAAAAAAAAAVVTGPSGRNGSQTASSSSTAGSSPGSRPPVQPRLHTRSSSSASMAHPAPVSRAAAAAGGVSMSSAGGAPAASSGIGALGVKILSRMRAGSQPFTYNGRQLSMVDRVIVESSTTKFALLLTALRNGDSHAAELQEKLRPFSWHR